MIQGIIGRKLGMTQIFLDSGNIEAVTAIEVGPCTIVGIKTESKEGYNAAQLGFGEVKERRSAKKKTPKDSAKFKYHREFKIDDPEAIEIGQGVDASLFNVGDLVNITGISKGKGFAGVVKRHHFSGGPKTHGQSDRHRAPGSIGPGTSPGRVFKGMRMAGHMGNERVTVKYLEVFEADPARNLLLVKGAVPGARNGLLLINKASKGKK